MNALSYLRVNSVDSAMAAMGSNPNAMFVAGGTTVVDLLREGVFTPDVLVDISSLPLRDIKIGHDSTEIGAMVPNSDLAWHPGVKALFPVLSQALLAGASGQIRNMASVGGNLLQRTRCPYYRELSQPCNKRSPGTGCAALQGYNRSHAILGTSEHCIATHPSDFTVALTALDARILLRGPAGSRDVPMTDFYLPPGTTPQHETVLARDELIVGVRLPHSRASTRSLYVKVRDRKSFEFALASTGVAADVRNGVIREIRIALGGVATTPWRARRAEDQLRDSRPDKALFAAAAKTALAESILRTHNKFKQELAERMLASAMAQVTGLT